MISSCILASLLTVLIVFSALVGLATAFCFFLRSYYEAVFIFRDRGARRRFTVHLTKRPRVCKSTLIAKHTDGPAAAAESTAERAGGAARLLAGAPRG